jgi:DNA-binding NarL/FixJ family response regulator
MNRPNWRTVLVVGPDGLGVRIGSVLPRNYFAEVTESIDAKRLERRVARASYATVVAANCDAREAIATLRALVRYQPAASRVVVFESALDAGVLSDAFALGAHPVQWPIDPTRFAQFLETTERRCQAYVEARIASRFEEQLGTTALTKRQREICWNGTLGLSVKELADLDGVGISTVRTQQREIVKRLQVASIDAFRWRVLRGVLPPPRRRG